MIIADPFQVIDLKVCGISYSNNIPENQISSLPIAIRHATISRKASFLAGRTAVVKAMEQMNCTSVSLLVGQDRRPVWPDSVTGSISHSFPFAYAAVGKTERWHGIGIDVECIQSAEQAQVLTPKIVLVREAEVARQYFAPGLAETLVFSAKESIYKAAPKELQKGLRFDSAVLNSITRNHLNFQLVPPLNYFERSLLQVHFEVMDLHVLTLCAVSK